MTASSPASRFWRAIAVGLSWGAAAACHAEPKGAITTAILTEQSVDTMRVKPGAPVEIRLRAQPGTGFSWFPNASASMLSSMEPMRDDGAPGGWETQRFRFSTKRAGTYRLAFTYDQPWPGGIKAARSKSFTITVR